MTKETFDRAREIFNEQEYLIRLEALIKNASCKGAKLSTNNPMGEIINQEVLHEDIKNEFLHIIFSKQAELQKEFENL